MRMKLVKHLTVFSILWLVCCRVVCADSLDQWTRRDAPGFTNDLGAVAYGNGVWVALSPGGLSNTGRFSGTFIRSTNLTDWMVIDPPTTNSLFNFGFEGGLFVATANELRILTSPEGINWASRHFSVEASAAVNVAYGNGRFVCLVPYSKGALLYMAALLSSDGIQWTLYTPQLRGYYNQVAFGGGRFVAAGFQESFNPASPYQAAIATSPDGTNWTSQSFQFTPELYAVAHGNGMFVAGGDRGTILTSSDGTNWVNRTWFQINDLIVSLTYGQGHFVAVGQYNGAVLSSRDGINWARHIAATNVLILNDVAYHDGTFVVVGSGGAILQSDPVITLDLNSGSPVELTLAGIEGRSYRIEYLDGLQLTNAWQELTTIVLTNSPATCTDSTSSNAVARFYRATLLP
jgi:hypothetical protein